MPTWPSSLVDSEDSPASGESNLDPCRSTEARLLGIGLVAVGLPVKEPRASVTVFTPVSSDLVLLNILAAASELENRGGSKGLAFDGVLEKNRGDGGVVVLIDGPAKLKDCNLYAGLLSSLGFLYDDPAELSPASSERFGVPAACFGTPGDLFAGRCNCGKGPGADAGIEGRRASPLHVRSGFWKVSVFCLSVLTATSDCLAVFRSEGNSKGRVVSMAEVGDVFGSVFCACED